MNTKDEGLYITRIERFRDRMAGNILSDTVVFTAEYCPSKEPVAFDDRLRGQFKPIENGDVWGRAWDSAWFHLRGKIPADWKNKKIVARLDFSGEGLVVAPDGELLQGISNGSVFDGEFSRDIVPLIEGCSGGEEVELWVEAAASGLFGVFTESDPLPDSPNRYGHFTAAVKAMNLCVFDSELWHLWLDLKILAGLIKTLPKTSVRRARIIRTASEAIDAYADNRDNLEQCRAILAGEMSKTASASDLSVLAVGHAHIDTAWLWPVRESVRKCARTFASQIALIEKYPDYVFGASQPQHYAFVKEHYPALYEKIKRAVAAGRWEVQGGMWVEADCNLIGGESMIRQILHGKNFFMDEFGVDVKNLWLPDVFGYSAALPQILMGSGIDYFLTQKLSWNQFNEFPHHTFIWRGIDGSEVLAHFPPENTYNSQLGTEYLVPARDAFKEKDCLNEFICLFGVGDGGGGPKEENIELGRRMADLEGAPRLKFGTAADFFERLSKHREILPTWVGELYLELHRGTLTTQAKMKKTNRELEQKLRLVEMLWSQLPPKSYPAEKLDAIWKTLLRNQFHDIIPGSSITKVYEVTEAEYQEIFEQIDDLIGEAARQIFEKDDDALVLFNSGHYPYDGPAVLPEGWDKGALDEQGSVLPVQKEDDRVVVRANIEPYSFLTLRKSNGSISASEKHKGLTLENDCVHYEFDNSGRLLRGWDKKCRREIIEPGKYGNRLTLYDDHPNNWDAWDIDLFYETSVVEEARSVDTEQLYSGPVRQGIRFKLAAGDSEIVQDVYLAENSKRLDFVTIVDWREKHRMLRVAYPVNVISEQAGFDIQYGYVKRPTHRNTSWERARFEAAAHRYADLSDNDFGVALLNDCKYGYKVHDNVLDLNLLRAPNYPDPDADIGRHEFTYSLRPHEGDLIRSDVMADASFLNRGIDVFDRHSARSQGLPWRLEGEGVSLEAVKKAEKEDCLIIRIVETSGRHSTGRLVLADTDMKLIETDLMEWSDGEVLECPAEINLNPFEIKTFKLRR